MTNKKEFDELPQGILVLGDKKKVASVKTIIGQSSDHIAYKIPSIYLNNFINGTYYNFHTANPDALPEYYDEKDLIGLQFRFGKNEDDVLEYVDIYRVYFDPENFFRKRENVFRLGLADEIYEINEFREGTPVTTVTGYDELEISHHKLNSSPVSSDPIGLYEKLDFFDTQDKVDFVYVTKNQMMPLITIYNTLIISGCQLKLGKKLIAHQENQDRLYNDLYFSLKIEGGELKNGYDYFIDVFNNISAKKSNETTTTAATETGTIEEFNEIEGPGSTVGYPCPPIWQTYSILIADAFAKYPALSATLKEENRKELFETSLESIFQTKNPNHNC